MAKLFFPLLLLVGLIALSVLTDSPAPKADFTFINRGDVTTMDLAIMSWQQDFRVARILYEGLTRHDVLSTTFRTVPGVAAAWDTSPDGLTYTFHLRPDAKWSNAQPVRAGDFVYQWRRTMLPDNAGDYSKIFDCIRGVTEFQQWRTEELKAFAVRTDIPDRSAAASALWQETLDKFEALVGVRAPDDHTLVVELAQPTPYFLDLTSFAAFSPVYPPATKAYESLDPDTGRMRTKPDWTKPPNLITNGPFMLTRWRFMRDMRMEKNPYYWDKAGINIDTISIPAVQDANAQVMAFKTGAVDWVSDVTPVYRADMLAQKQAFYDEHRVEVDALTAQGLDPIEIDRRLPADPRNTIHCFPAFGTYFYNFNCMEKLADGRPNPFHDPRVRRAFTMATDKRAIVEMVRRTNEPIATALIPPGSIIGYKSPEGLPYDPGAARALLAEAGYPDGKGFITVDILFNKDGGHDTIAQSIAKNWQENLGVQVTLSMKEIKVLRDQLKNADYIVSRGSWFGDYSYPTTFLNLSRTNDGNNDRKYSNPAYDALLDAAKLAAPPEDLRLLERAEAMLMNEEVPVLPIFHYMEITLFDAHRITGISSHPRQEQNLYLVDVLGDGKGRDVPRPMIDDGR